MKKIYDIIHICNKHIYCIIVDDKIFTSNSMEMSLSDGGKSFVDCHNFNVDDINNKDIIAYHHTSNILYCTTYYSVKASILYNNRMTIKYNRYEKNELFDTKKFLNRYEVINELI